MKKQSIETTTKFNQSALEPQPMNKTKWVVMGVCGSGKTEVGQHLAAELGLSFIEGDRFHPAANIDKMSQGIPLNDEDRQTWLQTLQNELFNIQSGVLSCSALKRSYRDILRTNNPHLIFVHLHGNESLLSLRLNSRTGHFMPVSLLHSQLADLQPLEQDENGLTLDIQHTPDDLVQTILRTIIFHHPPAPL